MSQFSLLLFLFYIFLPFFHQMHIVIESPAGKCLEISEKYNGNIYFAEQSDEHSCHGHNSATCPICKHYTSLSSFFVNQANSFLLLCTTQLTKKFTFDNFYLSQCFKSTKIARASPFPFC